MKKIIIITGGAGFVGANLIRLLIQKTNFNIICIDNYSSGSKKNHINSKKIRYGSIAIPSKLYHQYSKI